MLRGVTRLLLCAASPPAWAATSHLSFARAPGFRQATKDEHLEQGSDLALEAVPVYVIPEIISEEEERALLRYTEGLFKPLTFADGHYDNLIEHYKEFYRNWHTFTVDNVAASLQESGVESFGPDADRIDADRVIHALTRAREEAQSFVPEVPLQERVHLLQLEPHGFIRAHADEQRNSSAIVAGLTLGSGRVMSLTHEKAPGAMVDMLLAPRSMYVLTGAARTEWHHSVDAEGPDPQAPTPGSPVMFAGRDSGIRRERRTAVIFRGMAPMELFMARMAKKGKPVFGAGPPRRQGGDGEQH